jgi:hypothetical protein
MDCYVDHYNLDDLVEIEYPEDAIADSVARKKANRYLRNFIVDCYIMVLFIVGCCIAANICHDVEKRWIVAIVFLFVGLSTELIGMIPLLIMSWICSGKGDPVLDESKNAFVPVDTAEQKLMELAPREFFCRKFLDGKVLRIGFLKSDNGTLFARYWYQDDNADACYCGNFPVERMEAHNAENAKLIIREDTAILQTPLAKIAKAMDGVGII